MKKFLNSKSNKSSIILNILAGLALAYSLSVLPAYSQQIIPDGYTQTALNTNGSVTDITTQTVKNQNAFNSFSKFNVNSGNTVNLIVPGNAENLINIVKNETTNINGVLNSIKNGTVGGNIYLVNPYGVVVGAQGVINVGSLTAVTPTKAYVDNFFNSPGNPNDDFVNALLTGTAPVNSQAVVEVSGKISAASVNVNAGNIINNGVIDLSDLVNVEGLSNVDEINLVASGTVELNNGSIVSVAAKADNANAGKAYIFGSNQVNFNKGALVDISGGKVSGNGGFVEISSDNNVSLGGSFKATVADGDKATILIDPPTVDVTTNQLSDGANILIWADNWIRVHDGIVVSSRQVTNPDNVDHTSAPSIGNSGNITFDAQEVYFNQNSVIASFGDSGFASGNITVIGNWVGVGVVNGVMNFYPGAGNMIFSRKTAGNATISNVKGLLNNVLTLTPAELGTIYLGTTIIGNYADTNDLTANITVASNPGMAYPLIIGSANSLTVNDDVAIQMAGTDLTLASQTLNFAPGSTVTATNIGIVCDAMNFDLTDPNTSITSDQGMVVFSTFYPDTDMEMWPQVANITPRVNANTIKFGNDSFTNQNARNFEVHTQLSKPGSDLIVEVNGSILDATADENPLFVANNITFNTQGSVGLFTADAEFGDDIDIDTQNNGVLTVNSIGFVNITETMGDMLLNNVTSNDPRDNIGWGVKLSAANNILDGRTGVGVLHNIVSDRCVILNAGGNIGTNLNPIVINSDVDGLNGLVSASSNGPIYLTETSGDMRVNVINNGGNGVVQLISAGSILDGSVWEQPNILSTGIILNAQNGTLGLQADDLDVFVNYQSVDGVLDATAAADLNISQYMGNLPVFTAESQFGITMLSSASSILDGNINDESPNVTGSTIQLTSTGNGGSFGLYSDSLDVNLTAGNISAHTNNGFIWLDQTGNNPLNIEEISNNGLEDTFIFAAAGIFDGSNAETPNVITSGLYMNTSAAGGIGTVDNALDINTNADPGFPGGLLLALSNGLVNINETDGDLQLYTVSNAGNADVTLSSAGSIYDGWLADEQPNVYARSITLNAAGFDVGGPADDIDIALNYNGAVGGVFTATAFDRVNISQATGNIILNTITAGNVVTIDATNGSILTNTILPTLNISQPWTINMTATVAIGTVANPIETLIQPGGQINAISPDTHVHDN